MSSYFQVSLQGMILALERTGLRQKYDFSKNKGAPGLPHKKGYKASAETKKKLSELRFGKYKLARVERICPECGTIFICVPDSKNASENRTYCSNTCRDKAHSKRMTGRHTAASLVTCEVCGDSFFRPFSLQKGHAHQFCSRVCQGIWRTGKTYEELFGEERAQDIKEAIAIQTIEHNKNMPVVSKPHKIVHEALVAAGMEFLTSQRFSYFELDEFNPQLGIVVEVDGDYWHSSEKQKISDRRKDTFLKNKGLRVLRIRECDIYEDIEREIARVKEVYYA